MAITTPSPARQPRAAECREHTPQVELPRPALLTVEQAKQLSAAAAAELFCQHLNPGQFHFLKLLGFHQVVIERAEGMYYIDQRRPAGSSTSSAASARSAFGHNHPRIIAARDPFPETRGATRSRSRSCRSTRRRWRRTWRRSRPGDLDMVFLGSTGSEAVEAALKLAERVQGPSSARIAYAESSFHGKTRGALSVTDSAFYQDDFRLLEKRVRVPFGDAAALEAALQQDRSIGVLILETMQGGAGIVTAPPGYWREVRAPVRSPRRGVDRRRGPVRRRAYRAVLRLRARGRGARHRDARQVAGRRQERDGGDDRAPAAST